MSLGPECRYKREDCFAYEHSMCAVLQDTTFKGLCPFYKSQEQFDEEVRIYGGVENAKNSERK